MKQNKWQRIMDLKYYQFVETNVFGLDLVVARSGWSNQFGYEIYITREEDGGADQRFR